MSVLQWCLDGLAYVPLSSEGGPKAAEAPTGCAVRWLHRHCKTCGMPMVPKATMCELCRREEARLSTRARDVRAVDALRNHHGGPLSRSTSQDFADPQRGRKRLSDYDDPVKPPSRFAGKDRDRPLDRASPDG